MLSHVPEQRLLDVLEGRGAADRAHVDACPQCRTRLAEAQAGLALAVGAEVPEPSPLYWESLRRQVSRRVDEEGERQPAFWRRISLGPALAAAAVLAGIVTFLPMGGRQPSPLPERPLPAWSALPPAEEDEGLDVLRAVAPTVADASVPGACGGVAECVIDLSDEESQVLADHLRREIGEGTDL
jgi:anti-sigma factor RsiW